MVNICYESSHQMGKLPRIWVILLLSFFPILGLGLLIMAGYILYEGLFVVAYPVIFTAILAGVTICLAILSLALGWVFLSSGMARYRFTSSGLHAKYPFRRYKFIPWSDFQQICICYAAFTTRGEKKANTVICCVRKGEKKNIYGRWKTDNPFHYQSVICIDYSPELHAGLMEKCQSEVADLRNTHGYTL